VRLSSFNLYVENYPEPGMTLVHNTLSGGFALIDDETLALWKADAGLSLTDRERELVGDKDLSDSDVGVVVESREVEEAEFQAWFERRRRHISALEALSSINLACNFDCHLSRSVLGNSRRVSSQRAVWRRVGARPAGGFRMNFIEQIFGFSPDAGSGALELALIVVALAGIAVLAWRQRMHVVMRDIPRVLVAASESRRRDMAPDMAGLNQSRD
jgi:hypothetical protein